MNKEIEEYFEMDEPQIIDDTLSISLWYPRNSKVKSITVGLMDVRAADDIRIEYDFKRDGWVIKQASKFSFTVEEAERGDLDPDWQEVAFIKAWAREKPNDLTKPAKLNEQTT